MYKEKKKKFRLIGCIMFQRKNIMAATFVVAILAAGLFSTWLIWNYTVRRLSEEAMQQALLVAQSINHKRLENLQGNIEDRWGILITSLVPLHLKGTNKLFAVLGMDIDASDWRKKIISQCLLPVSLTISIILLAAFLLILNRNRRIIKMRYIERNRHAKELQETLQHVKKLQGLLPICASCKKIRDDKGYWNEIEGYIQKHSDASFSHGLCPECAKKLYTDLDIPR